jgi:hypothetical protein
VATVFRLTELADPGTLFLRRPPMNIEGKDIGDKAKNQQ